MRKLLVTAVALAPLAFAATAHAQTVINTARTTPIATATADDGQPDDVVLDEAGSITVGSGAAITLNSDNDVTTEAGSDIVMEDSADGSAGILVVGGSVGSLDNSSIIRVTGDPDVVYEDTDDDGDLDGAFATGQNRYGIRVTDAGALDGDLMSRGGVITVEGNNSAGILVEGGVTGDFWSLGNVSILGDNAYGVRTTGDVGGDTRIGGTINATGLNAVGIGIDGDLDGALLIDSTINVTGFRYPVRPAGDALEALDADDLLNGGPGVRISGNVAGGVLLDRPTTLTDDDDEDDTDDLDGDGVIDADEGTVTINVAGSSPALQIGSTTQSVTLGVVGTGDNAYGLIHRGAINANGLYDGFSATGVEIGVVGGQDVFIEGGIRNNGAISASASEEDATALVLRDGAGTPILFNQTTLTAAVVAEGDFDATGLLIESGAALPALNNDGIIAGGVGGETSDAYGVRDLSGTLTSLTNTGAITASVSRTVGENDTGQEPITGRAIAIDLSANTTGVDLVQFGIVAPPDSTAADDDDDGVPNVDEPTIVGNIVLGSGADTFDIRNGVVIGGTAFGAGADRMLISGGAVVIGGVTDSDGQLDIEITDGSLDARQGGTTTISNLTVGEDGLLIIGIDPNDPDTPGFEVTGTANLVSGASLGVSFQELIQEADTFTVIRAANLEFGAVNEASIEENSPFLFNTDVRADEDLGEVYVDVRRKTAEEAGLITAEAGAYDSIYAAIDDDAALLNAFLSQTTQEGFIELYEQLIPDHSGGPLLALSSGVDAVTRALAGRNQSARPGETSAWVQEINFYAEKDDDQAYGFESEGFGVAGGVERGMSMGAFGITTAFTSTDLEDSRAQAEEVLSVSLIELGLYWRAQGQNWSTWARAAGGYAWLDATREFVGGGLFRSNESEWDGYTIAAAAGASYEHNVGRFSFRPEVTTEYFMLRESAREESGGGDGFDLGIDERDGHLFSATAVMNVGVGLGENRWLRPEVRFGWRQNISFDGGTTRGRFLSGGPDFLLEADSIEGGGPVLGFRMNVGNDLGFVSIEGDAQLIDDYVRYALLLRASFRF